MPKEETNIPGMKEQRERRQRINRYKSMIIFGLGIWVIVSMLFCVGILIKVIQMDHTIKEISGRLPQMVTTEDASAPAGTGESQSVDLTGQTADSGGTDTNQQTPTQKSEPIPEGETRKVYLSFDDGPSENTGKVLDILKAKGIKATFFVIGHEGEEAQAYYRRILAEGHTLAMHSYTHKYSVIYSSVEAFAEDFDRLNDYLISVTGVTPKYMRFPGGSSNKVSNVDMKEFIRYLKQRDITYFDWNVDSGDGTSQAYTAETVHQNVLEGVGKYHTSVVLMHDASNKKSTVEALPGIIDDILAMGAEILPIDDNTKLIQHISADSVE
ncbi:hypothetical protein FACS1894111_09280 [Clostridia bacterium]|nr:hypothetical protein FACS1894111_09280 [Clostridia bacterium]